MDKAIVRKINRNNRKRGSNFEKTVADYLEMFPVPYSGSNDRFGQGDIRDVQGTVGGVWLGECKNMTLGDTGVFVIDHKWIKKHWEKAEKYGLLPFLAFMAAGKPWKFVMITEKVANILCFGLPSHEHLVERKSVNSINIRIPLWSIQNKNNVRIFAVDGAIYRVVSLESFKHHIMSTKAHAKFL